jgi:ArsR family transcriptional regulator
MSKAAARGGEEGRAKARRLFERRTKVMKALAHPSRLAMVDALAGGERCVCDLQALVGADMSTVSKHLSLLREAGVVLSEKRGQQVWYRLEFFSCVDAVFADPDAERVDVVRPDRAAPACRTGCAPAARP